jgi:glycosyltransferase involved in cell wall biosynthesis
MNIYVDGSKRHAVSRMFPVWESLEHAVVNKPGKADIQLSVVRIGNDTGLPIVLRVDGVYYDKDIDYKHTNLSICKAHRKANAVIYQSNMARQMCERYLGERQGPYSIIHNGIDPSGWNNPVAHTGINIFCCGKWRRPKRLEETIKVFNLFRERFPFANLWVIGGFKKGGKPIPGENITYCGQIDHEKMQGLYRIGDMFLHLCKKDSCPSSVVEAIAAGMPVITTNACGGATEMCRLTPGCVVVPGEAEGTDPDYIYRDAYNKMPKDVMINMVKEMIEITENNLITSLPYELTIEHAAKKYLDVFEGIIH